MTNTEATAEVQARAAGTHHIECATDALYAALGNVGAYMPGADDDEIVAAATEDAIDALNSGACICHKL